MSTVSATKVAEGVRQEIMKLPEDSFYEIKPDTWLVAGDGTSRNLADHPGTSNGRNGPALLSR